MGKWDLYRQVECLLILPGAGGTPRGTVGTGLAAQPVPVEVGRWVIRGQPLLVALTNFGQDVHPVFGLHTVVGLDVQRSLGLNDLKHLI